MINVEEALNDLRKQLSDVQVAQQADHAQIEKLTRILYEAFPSLTSQVRIGGTAHVPSGWSENR